MRAWKRLERSGWTGAAGMEQLEWSSWSGAAGLEQLEMKA